MNKNLDIITFNEAPNFSVVVPNACGCRCSFCFDNQKCLVGFDDWYAKLEQVIDELPEKFTQVSVTGGEVTKLSVEQLLKLMKLLYANFDRVVVTTNAEQIYRHISALSLATFINISYHGTSAYDSNKVFKSDIMVSPPEHVLNKFITQLKALETKVRIQKVCTVPPTLDEVFEYVSFCKSMGANDIAIRMDIAHKDALKGDWIPIPTEKAVSKGSCPVCADWTYNIENIPVHFKAGLIEIDTTGVPYELIYRKDAKLSTSWSKVSVPNFISKLHKVSDMKRKVNLNDIINRYNDVDNSKWINTCHGRMLNPDYKEPLAILEKTYGKNKHKPKDSEIQAKILKQMKERLEYQSCRSNRNTPEAIIKDFMAMLKGNPTHPSIKDLGKVRLNVCGTNTFLDAQNASKTETPTETRVSTSCGSGGCGGGSGACGRSKATSCGSGGSC